MLEDMMVTDDIIAKYADGTASPSEISGVRRYLKEHTEESLGLLLLLDDHQDYLSEWEGTDAGATQGGDIADIMMSAAAFAPVRPSGKRRQETRRLGLDDFRGRLDNMLMELDSIE